MPCAAKPTKWLNGIESSLLPHIGSCLYANLSVCMVMLASHTVLRSPSSGAHTLKLDSRVTLVHTCKLCISHIGSVLL